VADKADGLHHVDERSVASERVTTGNGSPVATLLGKYIDDALQMSRITSLSAAAARAGAQDGSCPRALGGVSDIPSANSHSEQCQ
jgi:hypothetical protein